MWVFGENAGPDPVLAVPGRGGAGSRLGPMTSPDNASAPRPGRALLVYSLLRLALLLVSYAVLTVLGLEGLLAIGVAVLLSALLSLVLLKRQRDAFTSASMVRADERRQAKQTRRARLDDPDSTPD